MAQQQPVVKDFTCFPSWIYSICITLKIKVMRRQNPKPPLKIRYILERYPTSSMNLLVGATYVNGTVFHWISYTLKLFKHSIIACFILLLFCVLFKSIHSRLIYVLSLGLISLLMLGLLVCFNIIDAVLTSDAECVSPVGTCLVVLSTLRRQGNEIDTSVVFHSWRKCFN